MKSYSMKKIITASMIGLTFILWNSSEADENADFFAEDVAVVDIATDVIEADYPIEVLTSLPKFTYVDICYIDGYDTIKELIDEADIIVSGKVVGHRDTEFGLSIINIINTEEIYLGKLKEKKIEVLQPKDRNNLRTEKSYVLFLKRQGDILNQYYVMGLAVQGIFQANGSSLYPINEFMRLDFEKIRESASNKKSLKGASDLDVLKAYIRKNRKWL